MLSYCSPTRWPSFWQGLPFLGCNTGHTAGDFVSHRTCHLQHRTCHRLPVQRCRSKPQVWFRHRGINIPRYTVTPYKKPLVYNYQHVVRNKNYYQSIYSSSPLKTSSNVLLFFPFPLTALMMSDIRTNSLRLQSPKHNDAWINRGESRFRVK